MDIADKELVAEFVIESQEGLANVEAQMLSIEAAGADVDTDLVNSVFRTMHSIKGAAGFLGLDRIGTLAHGLEEILNNLRNREMIPTTELISTILRAADFMKGLIDEVEQSNDADVSPYIADLQRFRSGAQSTASQTTSEPADASIVDATPSPASCNANSVPLSDAAREFLIECYENLERMERELLALETDSTSMDVIRSVFRTVHTIKGGAGFLALGTLEGLAHAAENVLCKVRNGEQQLTAEIISVLLAVVDKTREGLRQVESTGTDTRLDAAALIDKLRACEGAQATTRVGNGSTHSATVQIGTAPAASSAHDSQTRPTTTAGEQPSRIGDVLVSSGKVSREQLEQAVEQQQLGDPLRVGEILVEKGIVHHEDVREAVTTLQGTKSCTVAETSIRVDVELLDKLMTRVGELVLARNQILQYTSKQEDSNFTSTAQRLNLITTELQESVMKTRMQPIGNVWSKFPRVVRDLSTQLGKQVRIEMEGKETELDKTIIESIKDPLTHLVRNSVDHGVESPEARLAASKPAEGCLTLRAYHEGGQVNIEISDDGAGLNFERIRAKAVERGLVTPDAAARMSEREAANLILLPGFSTADKVTAVSGRGVGMDVVKTNIERIGGTLDLQSRAGVGTTVKIKIPLTLAIIPALVVTCGGDRYAIPQVSLLELVRLEGEQARKRIESIHGAPVYRLRGQLLPIIYLRDELNLQRAEDEQASNVLNIVVLRAEDRQFGLVVDSINDTEEIVVKPLSKQLKGIAAYAGATIMGDGKVALILDVLGAAQNAHVVAEQRDRGASDAGDTAHEQDNARQTMLLLAIGDRQVAMPISMVARLEEIPRESVEKSDQYEVIQYRGQIMPLVRLADVLGIPTQDNPSQPLQIVVYSEGDHCLGFVVDRVADIADAEVTTSHKCESDELLASTVIQQKVTDLLNLPTIIRRVAPKLFDAHNEEHQLAV